MFSSVVKWGVWLARRLRAHPAGLALTAQAGMCAVGVVAAFVVRFDLSLPAEYIPVVKRLLLIYVPVKAFVFGLSQVHRFSWRLTSVHEIVRLLIANALGSGVAAVAAVFLAPLPPRSFYPLEFVATTALTGGACLMFRVGHEIASGQRQLGRKQTFAFIYGAGAAGQSLAREIHTNQNLSYKVLGFIDDSPTKQGTHVQGIQILGTGKNLKKLAVQHYVSQVLVAISNASHEDMNQIYEYCAAANIVCRVLPGITESTENRALVNQIRDISIEDLLGRKVVELDHQALTNYISGRVVMVTGCAGSIGSEMCNQIAGFKPAVIVGFEVAETPLFFLMREMKSKFPEVEFCAEIGSIQNSRRLRQVMRKHRPELVYHAAAYKHVPMMEANPYEAVANNVYGTETVLKTGRAEGVKLFVMISTDKAVRPTSVMGTTKRIAELVVNAHADEVMQCVSVRFGNVLGSNGSVIPIFKQQISAGGPVTVTHPEMRRYFMTIPEASQLVLQASALGKSGEIMVLEMGELVKIVDLATRMIQLAGLTPEEDIKINFTGVRPGEKLFEEINLDDESMVPTSHPQIRVFRGPVWSKARIESQLAKIRDAWDAGNTEELLEVMQNTVPEYTVNPDLVDAGEMEEEALPGKPDDPAEVAVTVLGAIRTVVTAMVMESSDRLVLLRSQREITVGSAVRFEYLSNNLLGEVCAETPVEGEDSVDILVRLAHRLRGTGSLLTSSSAKE